MKIRLDDYGMISKEWIEKEIKDIEEEYFKIPVGSEDTDEYYYDGALTYLKLILKYLQPLKPLAEKCFDEGSKLGELNIGSSEYTKYDKQQFLNGEIEI